MRKARVNHAAAGRPLIRRQLSGHIAYESMIRKSGNRFSEKIMLL